MVMARLPTELVDEILCRTPLTSTRAVRSSCKKWNKLSKDGTFKKKHLAQSAAAAARKGEFLAIMMQNFRLYLKGVNLHGIDKGCDPSVEPRGKLISLSDSDQVGISRVSHCQGLLLCTTQDYTRLVVWNPYTGLTRWICVEPRSAAHHQLVWYGHALGYDKSTPSLTHKVLRFIHPITEKSLHEMYDLNSSSWRVLDVSPDWEIDYYHYGVSLKGDSYWFAHDKESRGDVPDFLICFDFTAECFGPRLPLPFESFFDDSVILSTARDEQLAVLFQRMDTLEIEVWVTTKIVPNAVSWSKFLAFDMEPVALFKFDTSGSFLIDEESKAVVVFDQDKDREFPTRETAHILGENGYHREVDLGKIATKEEDSLLRACSYVPSTVQPA